MDTDTAVALARKMADDAEDDFTIDPDLLLPYARALIQAEKALARVKDEIPGLDWTGAGCCPFCDLTPLGEPEPPCALADVLAALRAVIGEP